MGCAVVLTQPNRERTTAERIHDLGFQTWLPLVDVLRSGRYVTEPLFFRYVFVWVETQWRAIRSVVGVVDFLYNGEYPGFVPDHTADGNGILDLRARERDGVIRLPLKERFAPGESVLVGSGRMAGKCGLYDGMTREARCKVLFDMMGRYVPVEVDEAALSAA